MEREKKKKKKENSISLNFYINISSLISTWIRWIECFHYLNIGIKKREAKTVWDNVFDFSRCVCMCFFFSSTASTSFSPFGGNENRKAYKSYNRNRKSNVANSENRGAHELLPKRSKKTNKKKRRKKCLFVPFVRVFSFNFWNAAIITSIWAWLILWYLVWNLICLCASDVAHESFSYFTTCLINRYLFLYFHWQKNDEKNVKKRKNLFLFCQFKFQYDLFDISEIQFNCFHEYILNASAHSFHFIFLFLP